MIIGDSINYIQLNLETFNQVDHEFTFWIKINTRYFSLGREIEISAVYDDILLSLENLHDFINKLEILESSRQGSVRLLHYSDHSDHCPFRFRIFSLDKLGHIAINIGLGKSIYLTTGVFNNKVDVTFEIDPSTLPNIIEEFRAIISPSNLA